MSKAATTQRTTAPPIPLADSPDDDTGPYARSVVTGIAIGMPVTAVLFVVLAVAAGIEMGADAIGIAVFAAFWVGLLFGGVAGVGAWSARQHA
ncbi:MAG: hypothetical protein AAGD18_12760 [Actinomycetota bacterium]